MKAILTATLFVVGISAGNAQESPRLHVGLTAGTHLSWQVNSSYSNFEREYLPGIGWKIGMTNEIDLKPRLALLTGLSVVMDETRTVYKVFDVSELKDKTRHTWLDANATFLYKPLRRPSFSLVAGVGFSTRRIIRSTYFYELKNISTGTESWFQRTMTDGIFTWNYFVTPQIGAEFTLPHNGGRLLCLIQYQQGLRELYRPIEPPPSFDYAIQQSHHKLLSAGLSVSWMMGIKKRSDFRNPNN